MYHITWENGTVFYRFLMFSPCFLNQKGFFCRPYLQTVKAAGLRVFLLEYGADKELARKIDAYCIENGFRWYNAQTLNLE